MDILNKSGTFTGRIVDYNIREELEHGIYVSKLARATAHDMHLSPAMVYNIALAGLLHDIGKLKLEEEMKAERESGFLVTEEIKYVRSHARHSFKILEERGYPLEILEIVRYHHENYDGTGYPSHLRGEEIPLGARVVRVCDVFAALTTDRPYRQRFTVEDAMQMMIDECMHYDMQVFLHFQRLIHRVGSSYQYHLSEGDLTWL
ncbi:MAG: HD domain-containing protein [Lachnospiraceae bacterium]|nr:HD domain-containing protein [Lachnospiraceae bacterium]